MSETITGLPPGWVPSKNKINNVVVCKHLEDFKFVEIRYEPDARFGHDYSVYVVNIDGPFQEDKKGSFEDLGKALSFGSRL